MQQKNFPGITVFTSNLLKPGMGICLPPFGIFVHPGASTGLCQHEYGHFLQYREMGFWRFYLFVGIPSLKSALFKPHEHQTLKVEKDANKRATKFFGQNSPIANPIIWPR